MLDSGKLLDATQFEVPAPVTDLHIQKMLAFITLAGDIWTLATESSLGAKN